MGTDCLNIGTESWYNFNDLITPCYIIDKGRLDQNIASLKKGFELGWAENVLYGYSVKTNSLPWIILYMKTHNFLAEVVSEQEYLLTKRLGFTGRDIILNGPVKSERILIEALNEGTIVNIDNGAEIEIIEKNILKAHAPWRVGLRYNFFLERTCPGETIVGENCSRFGFNIENGDFERAVKRLNDLNGLKIIGLHGHNSTRTKSLNIFKAIAGEAARLNKEFQLNIKYLDIGGGFFGDKKGAPDFYEYANTICDAFGNHNDVELIIEPGAGIISSPISYLCEVKNIRNVSDKVFLTTDGSLIHIDPMMHGIKFSREIYKNGNIYSNNIKSIQELCGFTCIEMDRMGRIEDEEALNIGDRVEFLNCGSYSMTLSPLFISYFPRVYVRDTKKYKLIRDAWNEEEFIQKCEVRV
jgi:Diaminopimelate decarboxylase